MFNEENFKELFDLYYVPLCYYARKYKLDHYESEEVVQKVFLKIWERKDQLSIEKSISAYLYQSVKNQSINYIKQKSNSFKNKEEYALKLMHAELFSEISEEDGSSALLARELEHKINQAIEELPTKCKQIFLLSRKDQLSMKEISATLNISTNTVQKQISIAISKLRDLLKYYLTVILVITNYFF